MGAWAGIPIDGSERRLWGMKSGSHREGGAAVAGLESGHWPLMN